MTIDKKIFAVSAFDAADYLKNDAEIQDYLEEARQENSPQALIQAINTIARAKETTQLHRAICLPKESK